MAAVTPAEFYKANINKEKEYVRITVAYEVGARDMILIGAYQEKAKKDGYQLGTRVLDEAELAAETASAEGLELAVPKEDLSAEELRNIAPVGKGHPYTYNAWGSPLNLQADNDGFLIDEEDGYKNYLSNFDLTSHFNYTGKMYGSQKKERVVTSRSLPPVKGIILDKATAFIYEDGDVYTACKGSFIYASPATEGGYKVEIMNHPNARLRLSADWRSRQTRHDTVREKQVKLNANAPRVKLL